MSTYNWFMSKINSRKLLFLIWDILFLNLGIYLALLFRFDGAVPVQYMHVYLESILWITAINIVIFYIFHLYNSLWLYASIEELVQIFWATIIGMLSCFVFARMADKLLPRTVYFTSWTIVFLLIGGSRLSYRVVRRIKSMRFTYTKGRKRIMIVGAGYTGSMLIKELKSDPLKNGVPVVVIDDNIQKRHHQIHGVPVKGTSEQIEELAKKYRIDEIILAIPSATRVESKRILEICKKTKCKLRIMPTIHDLIDQKVSFKQVRDVNIEDLLGREPVDFNTEEISQYLHNEVVLVTGGGGSIGSELCRQIARFKPAKLIILDIYENNAYELQNELLYKYKDKLNLEVIIASVRDKNRLQQIFKKYRPGVVFHAAAHKHVPLMEDNPMEAVKNNVFGTLNTAECADQYHAKKFVLISTDKAVNPTNIMGATKRIAEMIIQDMNKYSKTEFVAVRFGNVLGSNGSVIPLFQKQIAEGGPVTVTHPDITRFFMTIPEAAQLVIQAGTIAKGGEIFILDMGQPVKIVDLAYDLIRLSGLEPNEDIAVEFTGLRPGEKLYEELLMAEEGITATKHKKIFVSKPLNMDTAFLRRELKILEQVCQDDSRDVSEYIERLVPTYSKPEMAQGVV